MSRAVDITTPLEINPAKLAQSSIIWMHGLGADAHDFEPIVPHLAIPDSLGLRFIFPNAPFRSVTINGGAGMRAWYDILGIDIPRREDAQGIHESQVLIAELVEREQQRGIPYHRIVLAGFSQGGAMALQVGLRYPQRLAGILALSCYIPLLSTLESERHTANESIPIFMAHGLYDDVIPVNYARLAVTQLQKLGYLVDVHEYKMGHEVNWDEIQDISQWLQRVLK